MLRSRYLALILVVLACGWPAITRAQDSRGFSLTYDAYVSGIKALTLRFDLAVDDVRADVSDYRAEVEIETSGLVSAFTDWRLEAASWGKLPDVGAQPDRFRTANFRGDVARWVTIDYGEDGPLAVRSEPTLDADERDAVSVLEIAGTIDPMSALTQALMLAKEGSVCPPSMRIFDGRRRYDLRAEPMAQKVFEASRTAPFSGPAFGCRVGLERIAGFKEFESRRESALATNIEMWMSAVLGNGVSVPVRLVLPGKRSRMMVHLKKAELADGTVVFGD